jgi:hypothetical protein
VLVLRIKRGVGQVFFPDHFRFELLVDHAERDPFRDLLRQILMFEYLFEQFYIFIDDLVNRDDIVTVQDELGFVPDFNKFILEAGDIVDDLVGNFLDGWSCLRRVSPKELSPLKMYWYIQMSNCSSKNAGASLLMKKSTSIVFRRPAGLFPDFLVHSQTLGADGFQDFDILVFLPFSE